LKYFSDSGDKMNIFYDVDDESIKEKHLRTIKPRINKIGHAIHALNPTFKRITLSQNVRDCIESLGYKKPIICESMYIMKRKFSGIHGYPHQDATYIDIEPNKDNLVGIWIAMEDCSEENGCLRFIPGSHKDELKRQFIRNPDENDEENKFIYTSPVVEYDEDKFVSVPLKKGSGILMNGLVVHKSSKGCEDSEGDKSREVYVFHIYDSDKSKFTRKNW
jgi:phytanoyl-CoA hydroxylase